jgi:hypothetical protein
MFPCGSRAEHGSSCPAARHVRHGTLLVTDLQPIIPTTKEEP